ncbi:hypothetical protein [Polaribacter ponticola]|uniref:Uncharacterized protein n=1 Tax=Polaribacter ponticola TaxID=2978475 RepID=A0ABT5SAG4_9FLAO|nr:hypothetical protein [Polaribacter sp. MSW5]MDD7915083.1 hypothetical protein [Polaribacter sp. MSW5]
MESINIAGRSLQYISLFVALLYIKKYKSKFYTYFVLYLFCACLTDFVSSFIKDNNFWFINLYTFFEFNLVALIYYNLIKSTKTLKLIIKLVIVFNLIYFLSFIVVELQKYTTSLEGVVNSVFIILFFKELLNSNKILNYKKLFSFWMSVGFLIFYLVTIPFFTLLFSGFFNSRTMFPILLAVIAILHLSIIYGLITCKKMEA